MIFFSKKALVISIIATLPACSVMRSYNDELTKTINLSANGQLDQAIQEVENNNKGSDKELLYYLEKGELQRWHNSFKDSAETWLEADHKVKEWEDEAKVRVSAVAEGVGSVLLNDKVRRYDGHDYEKVMLSTQLALDYLLLGDWNLARTEIKKTHEREAIIEEVRAKETTELENESKSKGVTTTFKDLKGYPVATLDDPEVISLKNSYQSAISHYLAGFVYESLNEPSLAAPGYRKAIELRPGLAILEEGLAGLDSRLVQHTANTTDLLIIIESGTAPSLTSLTIPIPVIAANLGVIPISFPLLNVDPSNTPQPRQVLVDSLAPISLSEVTSIDTMSRRALRDDMPGIILRGVLRATAKAVSQKALMDQGGGAAVAGIVLNVANVITESADERTWRTLPSKISIARLTVPVGVHEFQLAGTRKSIDIKGAHGLLVARAIGNQVFWSEPQYTDQMPSFIATPPVLSTEGKTASQIKQDAKNEKKGKKTKIKSNKNK